MVATSGALPPSARGESDLPYAPSVVDRLMEWVDRLPRPAWWFYAGLLVALIAIANGVTWLDGSTPFGRFSVYRTSIAVYPVASLALMHYLNGAARRALAAFRPALGAAEADYARFEYELTILPGRGTWVALGLSVLFTAAFTVLAPNRLEIFSSTPWLFGLDVAIYVIVFALVAVFVYHTLHQLRMVTVIHAAATNVDLFQITPLYAFSRLTAQTGMSLLLLNYFSVLTDPATFVNPALVALTILAALGAVACFVVPLRDMHDRIGAEKKRLQAEASLRLEAAIQQVYQRADARRLSGIEELNQLMASLVTARDVLAKIPTWPWDTGTLAGFVSAFLPAIVGLALFAVEQFFVITPR